MTAIVLILSDCSGAILSFVPQQCDRFASRLQSQLAIRFAANYALGLVGIDIRIVKQSQLEFPIEHRRHEFIELRLLQHALAHQFHEVQIAIRIGQFDVDAGLDRQRARFLLVLGHEMAVVSGR